jgi:aspartate carbamoyltransferase catalytic subunit
MGEVGGKKVVIVGDVLHSRVALSNIYALQMQGAEVKVCGPKR